MLATKALMCRSGLIWPSLPASIIRYLTNCIAAIPGATCPWSRIRNSVHHFVNVVVEGNTLSGQAIKIDGTVIDEFTVHKESE